MESYEKMIESLTDEELMELSGGFVSTFNPAMSVVAAYGIVATLPLLIKAGVVAGAVTGAAGVVASTLTDGVTGNVVSRVLLN